MQHPAKIYESYTLQKMPSDDILHTIWNQLERHFEGIIPRAYRTEQWATWFADTTQPTSWIVQRLFEHSDMKHQAEYLLPSLPWWPTAQLTTPRCLDHIEGFGTTVPAAVRKVEQGCVSENGRVPIAEPIMIAALHCAKTMPQRGIWPSGHRIHAKHEYIAV